MAGSRRKDERVKKGLPFERHTELGKELKEMRNSVSKMIVEIGGAYPFTGARSRPYHHLNKALEHLDLLRVVLDDEVFREYPDGANTKIYYPD